MSQSSIDAIHNYKQHRRILNKPMKEITAIAKVLKDDIIIFDDKVKICFSSNVWQNEINISWRLEDVTLKTLGLHKGYNTNYQLFSYSDGVLCIIDDELTIKIE